MDEKTKNAVKKLLGENKEPAVKSFKDAIVDPSKRPFYEKVLNNLFEGSPIDAVKALNKSLVKPYAQNFAYSYLSRFLQSVIYGNNKTSSSILVDTVSDIAKTTIGSDNYHRANALAREALINAKQIGSAVVSSTPSYQPLDFKYPEAANDFIEKMKQHIELHKKITLNEINSWREVPGTSVDPNWGWTDLKGVTIQRLFSVWRIVMPDPIEFKTNN